MIDKLITGKYRTFFTVVGGFTEDVGMLEIVDPSESGMDPGAVGYTYDDEVGAEIVRRWNMHEDLVRTLKEARAFIHEAKGNGRVLDWEETDLMLGMIMDEYQAAHRMSRSLLKEANKRGISLSGLTIENFNTFLDDAFNDDGEVRCEKFVDLALPYSMGFGEIESDAEENARWRCIALALSIVSRANNLSSNTIEEKA